MANDSQPAADFVPEVGGRYYLSHCRFGRAVVRVKEVYDVWANVTVLSGVLRGHGYGAGWRAGESKMVRLSHCTWEPAKPTARAGD